MPANCVDTDRLTEKNFVMKNLKDAFDVLAVVSLMVFLTSCCCLRCHKPTCVNLIRDGNFEDPDNVSNYGYEAYSQGQSFGFPVNNIGVWLVAEAETNMAVGLFPNTYNTSGPNQLFHATPDGTNFVYVGLDPQSNAGPFPASTLKQDIVNPLKAGTYKLSFLQAAFSSNHPEFSGLVNVQLTPTTDGGQGIFNQDFSVTTASDWMTQNAIVTIKPGDILSNPTGLYTIKFISYQGNKVALIDAVMLCEQH